MINYFYYRENAEYPLDPWCRPGEKYPEYQFSEQGLSAHTNEVYHMMRDMFYRMNLDKENYGKEIWNPLGVYIQPGQTILLKPNLVKHVNTAVAGKAGMECLVTHPSVLRCIIDYVLIALGGTGKIIIADAPVQGCDFESLLVNGGYQQIIEFYHNSGIDLMIEDLRNVSCVKENGVNVSLSRIPKYRGKEIDIGEHSYFYDQDSKGRLRITNYDYHVLNRHHQGKKQEYCISEACLLADVVINLPKPKAHRKAGYTGALKNFVGVNTSKEYLPHHTKGSLMAGKGDEYYYNEGLSRVRSNVYDWIDILNRKNFRILSRTVDFAWKVLRKFGSKHWREKFSEGSWWGNNTVWKMVLDVNYIVLYADKNGVLQDTIQRKIINVGDMIYCGEKEGPLEPDSKQVGGILFSENAVSFDWILTVLMGFNQNKLPVLENAIKDDRLVAEDVKQLFVLSNDSKYNGKVSQIKEDFSFHASVGWVGIIDKYEV